MPGLSASGASRLSTSLIIDLRENERSLRFGTPRSGPRTRAGSPGRGPLTGPYRWRTYASSLLRWTFAPVFGGRHREGGEQAVLAPSLGAVHGLVGGVQKGLGVFGATGALHGPGAEAQLQ